MLISLNYLLAALTAGLAADLFRRGEAYRTAAWHMASFCLATLLGGLGHQVERNSREIHGLIAAANARLPATLQLGSLGELDSKLWFATFVAIGATEYFFMRIFLHPVAQATGRAGTLRWLRAMFGLFVLASLLTSDYPLVLAFHLVSHLAVIGLAAWLIRSRGLRAFSWLIALCLFNLGLGGLWALQGLQLAPSGPLHPNDWYHLGLMAFAISLHAVLTRTDLIPSLASPAAAAGITGSLRASPTPAPR